LLGWKKIPAIVVDFDAMHAELAEIDENVVRKDLSAIERSKALARRKELYEALHPETKADARGGHVKAAADKLSVAPSFAADTAAATGQSERQVRRDVAIGIGIPDSLVDAILESPIADNKKQLGALAKLDEELMPQVLGLLVDGNVRTVAAAMKQLQPEADEPTPDADGGAEQVTSCPLAEMEADPVGVDSDQPKDRITWLLAQLDLMWGDYQAVFADDADWISWRVAQENFAILKGHE
jgi:ParB family chromosome partitioning protein